MCVYVYMWACAFETVVSVCVRVCEIECLHICGSISACVCVCVYMYVCVWECVCEWSARRNWMEYLSSSHSSPPQKVKQQEKQLVTQQVGKVKGYNPPCCYQSWCVRVPLFLLQRQLTSLQSRESSPVRLQRDYHCVTVTWLALCDCHVTVVSAGNHFWSNQYMLYTLFQAPSSPPPASPTHADPQVHTHPTRLTGMVVLQCIPWIVQPTGWNSGLFMAWY